MRRSSISNNGTRLILNIPKTNQKKSDLVVGGLFKFFSHTGKFVSIFIRFKKTFFRINAQRKPSVAPTNAIAFSNKILSYTHTHIYIYTYRSMGFFSIQIVGKQNVQL